MPKIYEYLGIVFLFYANEHLPIHVHAQFQAFENKLEFCYDNGKLTGLKVKKVSGRLPLPDNKLADALSFTRKYHSAISEKWIDFFVLRKKVKSEKINKKIK